MKFYQNKKTGEIIGVENMRELITHPTEQSEKAGFTGYSYMVIYDMICPNKLLGAGIETFCISHSYLTANYKRISEKTAVQKYPGFRQYRHHDLIFESEKNGIESIEIIRKQTF
jgi:hypothetical protein